MQSFDPEQSLISVRREFGEWGDVNPSVSRSTTFTVMDPDTMPEIFKGIKSPEAGGCFLYARHCNPTVHVLARYLAAMEGTEAVQCTASGMSAISCTLLQICSGGEHIIASDTIYGGTYALLNEVFPEMGITTTFVDPRDLSAVTAAITEKTRVIYVETMGNPTLKISNIPALSRIARGKGLILVVDNTFSPMVVSPARLGAHIVVYSLSKFVNGASDAIAGAICAETAFIKELIDLHTGRAMLLGPTMDARVAFNLIQRLPHLSLRIREHGRRALALSTQLENLGVRVCYPGLPSHSEHSVIEFMRNKSYGYGGMMTIDCGTQEKANELLTVLQNRERFGLIAVSLGYYDTLMSCSGTSTSSEISKENQEAMGLSPGLVRISVGLTGSLDARIEQITRAVKSVGLV